MNTLSGSTFGDLLRQYRLAAALSQEALAERAGLSVDAVRALERGRRAAPRPDTAARLVAALGLEGAGREEFLVASTAHHGDIASAPTAPPSSSSPPCRRIPAPLTCLLGREHEVAAITQILQEGHRLVTLTGPGGVGKTRLAIEVAATVQPMYADGAVFVDLSPVHIVGLVACTIALALGLQETGPEYGRDLLLEQLPEKQLLLVLDNFEQVNGAVPLVADLLEACSGLTMLVTSRVALRLRGEQQFPLAPLSVPETTCLAPDDLSCCPSVQLFVSRAQAVQPDFTVSNDNAAAVTAICRRLDGLPLALELAAPRIRLLPPAALAARLQGSLSALTPGMCDLPARQQTLQATLDWSYNLLSPAVQGCLTRLSVFGGGFSLDAAGAICAADASLDVLDMIDSLVTSSLLQQVARDGEPRFVMLQTVREYAYDKLTASGEADAVHRLHASYFAAHAEERLPRFHTAQTAWLDEWATEHENLRVALHWAWDHDATLGVQLAAFVWRFWLLRGHLKEARTLLEGLLERAPAAPRPLRAEVAAGAASLVLAQGDGARAAQWGQLALDLYRAEQHDAGAAEMLTLLEKTACNEGVC